MIIPGIGKTEKVRSHSTFLWTNKNARETLGCWRNIQTWGIFRDFEGVDWVILTQVRGRWWAVMSTVFEFSDSMKGRERLW